MKPTAMLGGGQEQRLGIPVGNQPGSLDCAAGRAKTTGAELRRRREATVSTDVVVAGNVAKKPLLTTSAAAAVWITVFVGILAAPISGAQPPWPQTTFSQPEIDQRRMEQARPRTAVAFNPADFDKYVGFYEIPYTVPPVFMHIFREQNHYFLELTGAAPMQIYPESSTKFFTTVAPSQVSFNADANGQVVSLIFHTNGIERPLRKVDDATIQSEFADFQQPVQSKEPRPGTEAALRGYIDSLEQGQPNYKLMGPILGQAAQDQEPIMLAAIKKLGGIQSLTFKGIDPRGADIYIATFEHGMLEWHVTFLPDVGRIVDLQWRPASVS